MIVFDASALIGAVLKVDSVPEQALLRAEEADVFALSRAVEAEIVEVLGRPEFALAVSQQRCERLLDLLRGGASASFVQPVILRWQRQVSKSIGAGAGWGLIAPSG